MAKGVEGIAVIWLLSSTSTGYYTVSVSEQRGAGTAAANQTVQLQLFVPLY